AGHGIAIIGCPHAAGADWMEIRSPPWCGQSPARHRRPLGRYPRRRSAGPKRDRLYSVGWRERGGRFLGQRSHHRIPRFGPSVVEVRARAVDPHLAENADLIERIAFMAALYRFEIVPLDDDDAADIGGVRWPGVIGRPTRLPLAVSGGKLEYSRFTRSG